MTEYIRKWSEMFPEGRWVFYEGNDPDGFANEMVAKFGFDPRTSPFWDVPSGDPMYHFLCPSRCIDEVYGNKDYPLGS